MYFCDIGVLLSVCLRQCSFEINVNILVVLKELCGEVELLLQHLSIAWNSYVTKIPFSQFFLYDYCAFLGKVWSFSVFSSFIGVSLIVKNGSYKQRKQPLFLP